MVQNPILALTTRVFGMKRVMFSIPRYTREDVLFLKSLMDAGEFRAVIDRSYPLDGVAAAFDYVRSGANVGNVAIRVAEGD